MAISNAGPTQGDLEQRGRAERHLGELQQQVQTAENELQPKGAPLPDEEVQHAEGGRRGEEERQCDASRPVDAANAVVVVVAAVAAGFVDFRQVSAKPLDQAQEHEHREPNDQLVHGHGRLERVVQRLGADQRKLENGVQAEVVRVQVHQHLVREQKVHVWRAKNKNRASARRERNRRRKRSEEK